MMERSRLTERRRLARKRRGGEAHDDDGWLGSLASDHLTRQFLEDSQPVVANPDGRSRPSGGELRPSATARWIMEALQNENGEVAATIGASARVSPPPIREVQATPSVDEAQLGELLLGAQRAAEATLRDARERAAQIIADAEATAVARVASGDTSTRDRATYGDAAAPDLEGSARRIELLRLLETFTARNAELSSEIASLIRQLASD